MRRPCTHSTHALAWVLRAGTRRRARQWVMALAVVAVTVPTLAHPHPKPTTVYEVKDGDTLGRIAKRFGVSLRALIDANGLQRPDALRLGQRLAIPSAAVGAAPRAPAKAAARTPAHFVLTAPNLDGKGPLFRWPLEGPISSPFGPRRSGWHAGIDIKAEPGTPVFAAARGTVMFSGWEKLYGRVVKIEHEDGFMTVYAHNLQNFARTGDAVEAGQVIATVGRTGRASAYHLHFEIRNSGKVFNPLFLLPHRELRFVTDEESQPDEDDLAPW